MHLVGMRLLAGTWRALLLLTIVAAAGIGSVTVLGNRVERARTQNRLLSSLHIDSQRLHLAALDAALDAEVAAANRRDIRSGRQGMIESIRGLRGWSRPDLSLLRLRNQRFSATVERELSSIRRGQPQRLHASALEMGVRFKQLERIILRLQRRADERYDTSRRERDAVLLAIVALAVLTSGAFAWRARLARRDRAELLGRENERLTEVDRMKEEFVASVSHELRTPLTSIRGYLELVLEGDPDDLTPEHRDYLRIIDRNANRLLDLINDLLDVAQAESGRLALNLESVDLESLVADAVDGVRPGADVRQIQLGLHVAAGNRARLSIDRKRIGQVVDNLLSNAVKFTPDGGKVDVHLWSENGHSRVDVSDTGIGIPEAEQARLFERFFRTEAANGQAFQGTGLGLAISKAIVEAHGGRITVASAEGAGTTFSVLLPSVSQH
jgi:signal transduction histidine kinase